MLIARLNVALGDYQELLPESIHSLPRGKSPSGYPLTLWDDFDRLCLEVSIIGSTFDNLVDFEKLAGSVSDVD